jgi:predicted CxxxxCH...CXXCH cytochrome family protein
LHVRKYFACETGALVSLPCTGCHGATLAGQGLAVSCSTCHAWPLECGTCHGLPPANGTHAKHFGALAAATYRGTGTATALGAGAAAYAFDCGNCHPLDSTKHRDGTTQVELANPGAPVDSLKARNPAAAAYTPGPRQFTGEVTSYSDGTCSSVYCHSRLEFTAPFVPPPLDGYPLQYPPYTTTVTRIYSSPAWGGAALGCGGCHGMPPRSSFPENAAGAGDSHLWIDAYGLGNLHGYAMSYGPLACATCHYDTVTSQGSRRFDDSGLDLPIYDDVPIASFGAHVNGRADVRFTEDRILLGSTSFSASGGGGPVPAWETTSKTCTNVSCHFLQTEVTWGTPYRYEVGLECNVCHRN